MGDGGVLLRLDEAAGVMWVTGESREVWEVIQGMGRLGVGLEVDAFGSRRDTVTGRVVEVWSIVVADRRLGREFYAALTSGGVGE